MSELRRPKRCASRRCEYTRLSSRRTSERVSVDAGRRTLRRLGPALGTTLGRARRCQTPLQLAVFAYRRRLAAWSQSGEAETRLALCVGPLQLASAVPALLLRALTQPPEGGAIASPDFFFLLRGFRFFFGFRPSAPNSSTSAAAASSSLAASTTQASAPREM